MSLKIYFCGSIRAGRVDAPLYARLIEELKKYGTVLTEHVGDQSLLNKGEVPDSVKNDKTEKYIHDRDLDWLKETDVVVAEVTQPSLGVGYEIGRAVAMGKPILCLYRPSPDKKLSAMIQGAEDDKDFVVKHYIEEEAKDIFKNFITSRFGNV